MGRVIKIVRPEGPDPDPKDLKSETIADPLSELFRPLTKFEGELEVRNGLKILGTFPYEGVRRELNSSIAATFYGSMNPLPTSEIVLSVRKPIPLAVSGLDIEEAEKNLAGSIRGWLTGSREEQE